MDGIFDIHPLNDADPANLCDLQKILYNFPKYPPSLPGGGTAFLVSLFCRCRGHSIVGYHYRVTWGAIEGTRVVGPKDAVCQSLHHRERPNVPRVRTMWSWQGQQATRLKECLLQSEFRPNVRSNNRRFQIGKALPKGFKVIPVIQSLG